MNSSIQLDSELSLALMPHPILAAAPQPARALSLALTLGISSLILTALFFLQRGALLRLGLAPDRAHRVRTTNLLLWEPTPAPAPHPGPVKGPGWDAGEPGLGHVLGTDTIDAKLLEVPTVRSAQDLALSEAPSTEVILVAPGRPGLMADKSLPVAPGGNGLARGSGQDAGRGGGGASTTRLPDFQLVALHRASLTHRLAPGENFADLIVKVRLTLNAEGIPFHAEALTGPQALYAEAVQAALKFRFEPLAPHGLKAPFQVNIHFLAVLQH